MTAAVPITAVPTDVGAAAGWTAGAEYTVEALDADVTLVETASADAPAVTTRGHLLQPGTTRRPADVRLVTAAAGVHLWAWAPYGPAVLVWSEA